MARGVTPCGLLLLAACGGQLLHTARQRPEPNRLPKIASSFAREMTRIRVDEDRIKLFVESDVSPEKRREFVAALRRDPDPIVRAIADTIR